MMTVAREARLLFEHGTMPGILPPGAILGAAVRDLAKREVMAKTSNGEGQQYAFLAAHVRSAHGSVQKLLARAAKDIERGRASQKINTRRLYYSEEALTEALAMAKDRTLW